MFKPIYFTFPLNQSYRLWKLLQDLTTDWLSLFDFYFTVSFYRLLYSCLYLLREKWDSLNHRHHFSLSQTSRESDQMAKGHLWSCSHDCFTQSQAALRSLRKKGWRWFLPSQIKGTFSYLQIFWLIKITSMLLLNEGRVLDVRWQFSWLFCDKCVYFHERTLSSQHYEYNILE